MSAQGGRWQARASVTAWFDARGPWGRRAVLGLLGGVCATGLAPVSLWPLAMLAWAAVFALVARDGGFAAQFGTGWAVGTGYFLVALNWIVEPFLVDVARHGWMAPFALIGLAGGLALFWGAAFWGAARVSRAHRIAALVVLLPLAEALRGWVFTGFPWALIGHALISSPFAQAAAYVGPHGLSFVMLAISAGIWLLITGRFARGALILFMAALLYGGGLQRQAPLAEVPPAAPLLRLVQPNAPQHLKWDPAHMRTFYQRMRGFSALAGEDGAVPDLVIWPETALPVLLGNAAPTFADMVEATGGVPILTGIQRFDGPRLFNSAVLIDGAGDVQALYDKHHLVPFGEYIPFGDALARIGIGAFAAQEGHGYSAGPGPRVLDFGAAGRGLMLICYEAVFARDMRSAPYADLARPDYLLQLTNDAWFGNLSGPYQHLAQARLRAIEQGLPMVRVANTGVTALIGPRGRVLAQIPLGAAGYRDVRVPAPLPPTFYARFGDIPAYVLLIMMLTGLSVYAVFRRSTDRD